MYYTYNPYLGNNPNQYQQMSQMQTQGQLYPQPQIQTLNGKLVDSVDVARATEVPIGSYGVFPKADLGEIYVKTWNNNGTTSIITYKPELPQQQEIDQTAVISASILERVSSLESKIDELINKQQPIQQTPKKEVKKNEY